MNTTKKVLLGVYVKKNIYKNFEDVAWKKRLNKSELLRQLINEKLEKEKLAVEQLQRLEKHIEKEST